MNYVGKLLTDRVSGKDADLIIGTPDAHKKDVKLINDIRDNDNVTNLNSRYARKFSRKIQEWIDELTEGNAHKMSKRKVNGVSGQCTR